MFVTGKQQVDALTAKLVGIVDVFANVRRGLNTRQSVRTTRAFMEKRRGPRRRDRVSEQVVLHCMYLFLGGPSHDEEMLHLPSLTD